MVMYVDTSALLKRYVQEHDSEAALSLMSTDAVLTTSRLTEVETRRNLARLLKEPEFTMAKQQFTVDLDGFALIAIDETTCNEAARIAEQTLCRSADAIHIASALRAGRNTTFLTFDIKQAQAARATGLHVVGV